MPFYLEDIEIAEELDKDGDLRFNLSDISIYVPADKLLELRNHIDKVLLHETSDRVKKQFNLELAKEGEIGSKITNSDIARLIDIYNKLKLGGS